MHAAERTKPYPKKRTMPSPKHCSSYKRKISTGRKSKPFGVETRDALGDNNNVSIFGMPDENDWILLANYNDKTFMRNILSFDLFAKMEYFGRSKRSLICLER